MGRHAAGPPPDAAGPDDAPARESTPAPLRPWLRDGLVLAAVGALTTGLVLAWAVGTWWVAVLGGIGAAVVVLGASWVARSVPGPDAPPDAAPKVDR